ncbi:hypothetical protein ACER0C_011533 [Sarotherodon galilaeus]
MFPLWGLGFAWLIFALTTNSEPAVGANATSRKDCNRKDCNGIQYDIREAVCCENKLHPGVSIFCCGKEPYNPGTATCCKIRHGHSTTAVTQGLSENVSKCCDLKAYNPVNEICCQSTIVAKPGPMAECCGKEAYDKDKQLCCGPTESKMILMRNSSHHQCCGHNQYDTESQCCCSNEESVEIQSKDSSCCFKDFGVSAAPLCGNTTFNIHTHLCCQSTVVTKSSPQHRCCDKGTYDMEKELCCGPINDKKILKRNSTDHQCCYHDQFNTKTECCCWKKESAEVQLKNSSCCSEESAVFEGQSKSKVDNQVCCDGCASVQKPWINQCYGDTPYGLAQRGVLCCNNILYENRDDGEECSETGIPYNPAKGTICCSQFHGSPGKHCCGTEIYHPDAEICCNGHRHSKSKNIHCCGIKAYNIKDPQMKCCAGTLYNLTLLDEHGQDAQCCGSLLQKQQDICCSSEDREVLYSAKTGFRCCGHLYFNTTLWSCCAERLRSIHEPGQDQRKMSNESRLQSVNNMNKTDLCKKMRIGTVESVSLHSIVFKSVLKIRGKKAKVKALPFPYILKTDDRCSSPKLIPGKTYFFNKVNVFTDSNHDTVLQSLHFIFSKCSP